MIHGHLIMDAQTPNRMESGHYTMDMTFSEKIDRFCGHCYFNEDFSRIIFDCPTELSSGGDEIFATIPQSISIMLKKNLNLRADFKRMMVANGMECEIYGPSKMLKHRQDLRRRTRKVKVGNLNDIPVHFSCDEITRNKIEAGDLHLTMTSRAFIEFNIHSRHLKLTRYISETEVIEYDLTKEQQEEIAGWVNIDFLLEITGK